MENCIFCKIIGGQIPSDKVYEDELIFAFRDINPQAPVHILVIPRIHLADMNEVTAENCHIIARIFEKIPQIAKAEGLEESGYRVASNCGSDACQSVQHLHFHILGGRKLTAEMG